MRLHPPLCRMSSLGTQMPIVGAKALFLRQPWLKTASWGWFPIKRMPINESRAHQGFTVLQHGGDGQRRDDFSLSKPTFFAFWMRNATSLRLTEVILHLDFSIRPARRTVQKGKGQFLCFCWIRNTIGCISVRVGRPFWSRKVT